MPVTTFRNNVKNTDDKEILELLKIVNKKIKLYVCEYVKIRAFTKIIYYEILVPLGQIEYQVIQLPEYTKNCVLSYLYGYFLGVKVEKNKDNS